MDSPKIFITNPEEKDTVLWRYMDFLKFVDLLQSKSLWFTRLDQFQDPYEAYLPTALREVLQKKWSACEAYSCFTYEEWRRLACANCWVMSDYESAAMWELYSKEKGLAICSRPSRLREAIKENHEIGSWGLYGHRVSYVDFESFQPFFDVSTKQPTLTAADLHLKRKSFKHEEEYRLTSTLEKGDPDALGKHIPVLLNELIEEIRIAPTAPDWVRQVVQREVEVYGLHTPVSKSDLDSEVT